MFGPGHHLVIGVVQYIKPRFFGSSTSSAAGRVEVESGSDDRLRPSALHSQATTRCGTFSLVLIATWFSWVSRQVPAEHADFYGV